MGIGEWLGLAVIVAGIAFLIWSYRKSNGQQ